jgi:phosphoribosylanthranilate isomerase
VFGNDAAERIGQIVEETGLTAAQLHGDVTLGFLDEVHARLQASGTKIIRVMKIPAFRQPESGAGAVGWDPFGPGEAEVDMSTGQLHLGPIAALLVDSAGPERRGGTGIAFGWSAARPMLAGLTMSAGAKVIVAGGLSPENVAEAIATLRPWGVDVCSGVEREHGTKDHAKLHAFVSAARAADKL